MNAQRIEKHLRIDGSIRPLEHATHGDYAKHSSFTHEAMLHKTPASIPPKHARVDLEGLKGFEIASEFCDGIAHDGHCALLTSHRHRAGAKEPMHARNVREREIASIVYVQIQIEIIRPHA